jgi:hypothetical protein
LSGHCNSGTQQNCGRCKYGQGFHRASPFHLTD